MRGTLRDHANVSLQDLDRLDAQSGNDAPCYFE